MRLPPATLHAHRGGPVHVPVNLLALPDTITALGEPWHVKVEHHVTALDPPWLAERLDQDPERVWAAVVATLAEVDAGPVALTGELRRVQRGDERTLVVMAAVAGLDELHAALGARLGTELERPPAHVTLYTDAPQAPGIGIHDAAELAALTRPLDDAEHAEVRAAAGLDALGA